MDALQAALVGLFHITYQIVDDIGKYDDSQSNALIYLGTRTWYYLSLIVAWARDVSVWQARAVVQLSDFYLPVLFTWSRFLAHSLWSLTYQVTYGLVVDFGTLVTITLPKLLTPLSITAGAVGVVSDAVVHSRQELVTWASLVDNAFFSLRYDVWSAIQSQTDVLNGCVSWLNLLVRRDGVLRGTVLLNGLQAAAPSAINVLLGSGLDPGAAAQLAAMNERLPALSPTDILASFRVGSPRLADRIGPLVTKLGA